MLDNLTTRYSGVVRLTGQATRGNGRPHLDGGPAIVPVSVPRNPHAPIEHVDSRSGCRVPPAPSGATLIERRAVAGFHGDDVHPISHPIGYTRPAGQVESGPSFPGNIGLDAWAALSTTAKVDFLVRNATDRQQLADALTYGLEHGYADIGPSVGLAESIFNGAVAPSGAIAPSGCGCSVPVAPTGHMPLYYHGGPVTALGAARSIGPFFEGRTSPAQMIAPSAQVAPAATPAPGSSSTARTAMWVGGGAVTLAIAYLLLRDTSTAEEREYARLKKEWEASGLSADEEREYARLKKEWEVTGLNPTEGWSAPASKKKWAQWGVELPKKPTY